MSLPMSSMLRLVVSDQALGGRISVPLDAFLDYDEEMNVAVEELLAEWSDYAAPAAQSSSLQTGTWNR